jgi:hypothetical protein
MKHATRIDLSLNHSIEKHLPVLSWRDVPLFINQFRKIFVCMSARLLLLILAACAVASYCITVLCKRRYEICRSKQRIDFC